MQEDNSTGTVIIKCPSDPKVSHGLSAIGSATGLIYGIMHEKRWWIVLLLMAGGGMLGRGVGYVVDSKNDNQ